MALRGKHEAGSESVARLLEAVAGTDKLAAIRPSHIAIYRIVLELIPKLHGRSSKDRLRSVAEISQGGRWAVASRARSV